MSADEQLKAGSFNRTWGFAVGTRIPELLICLFLAASTLAVYWQVKDFEFIRLDDNQYVTANPYVQAGVTREGIAWAFGTGHASNWHPLTWLSHMLDCQFFGRDAGKHHFTSVVIHVGNTLILFLVLHQLTRALWRSALVAALFALHPLHVESVAWIAERKDVLSTFFGLLTIWAYMRYAQKAEVRSQKLEVSLPTSDLRPLTSGFYWLALFFFTLGLTSKPMLVTLPFVLLLLDYWPLNRFAPAVGKSALDSGISLLVEKFPFFLLTVASCVVTYSVQKSGGAVSAVALPIRLGNAVLSYLDYLTKTFWPDNLSVFYPYRNSPSTTRVFTAVAILLLATVVAVGVRRRRPYCSVGWFWFLGTLVPVIGLVQVGAQAMADRYSYLPLIGLFIAFVWTLADFAGSSRVRQAMAFVLVFAVMAACCVSAYRQTAVWRNSITLFSHALDVAPSAVAHDNLGTVFFDRREFTKARLHFEAALKLVPGNPNSHSNVGIILSLEGKFDEAIAHFAAALAHSPNHAGAHNNWGAILVRQGKADEALGHFVAAVRADPFHADAHVNLGCVLAAQKKSAEAIAHFEQALRCRPGFAEAHYQLANELFAGGNTVLATTHYRAALASNPGHAEAHYQLAVVLASDGAVNEAREHYRAAARLKPDWIEPWNNLAWLLATHPDERYRDGRQAVEYATRSVELTRTNDASALDTLAAAFAEAGDWARAVRSAETALGLAKSSGETQMAGDIEARLRLYERSQPFRHVARKDGRPRRE